MRKFDPSDRRAVAALVRELSSAKLPMIPLHLLPIGSRFLRIYGIEHGDPLGVGPGGSRFSDPNFGVAPKESLFSVLYAARSATTAFEEVVLRDQTDGRFPPHPISRSELARWQVVKLATKRHLHLVDLTASHAWRKIGLSTDAVRSSDHAVSRVYSYGIHENERLPDGILYPSRFSGQLNLALYDRAIASSMRVVEGPVPLLKLDLAAILRDLDLYVVDPVPDGDEGPPSAI